MEKSKNETFEFNAFQFLKDAVERGDITQEKMNIVVNATKNKSVLIEFAVHSEYPVTDAVTLAFADGYESAVGSEFLRNCMKPKSICSVKTSDKSELSKYDYQFTFLHMGSKQLVNVQISDYPIPQITEHACIMRTLFHDDAHGSCAFLQANIQY